MNSSFLLYEFMKTGYSKKNQINIINMFLNYKEP